MPACAAPENSEGMIASAISQLLFVFVLMNFALASTPQLAQKGRAAPHSRTVAATGYYMPRSRSFVSAHFDRMVGSYPETGVVEGE
jgi:hypothetical protein